MPSASPAAPQVAPQAAASRSAVFLAVLECALRFVHFREAPRLCLLGNKSQEIRVNFPMLLKKTNVALGAALIIALQFALVQNSQGHGDVQPQAVDTGDLRKLSDEIELENPYRLEGGEQYALAQEIGSSAYNQNCARCHGLEAISGGIAPDVRMLEDGEFGDEWFMERVRKGYSQNGTYKMPPFEAILSQEAMWAIRSYTETRPRPE